MSERLSKLINDTQSQFNLTDAQLAEKLFVPVKALEDWKLGLISPVYEPLLAMSLAFIRMLERPDGDLKTQERERQMKELNEQIEQLRKQRKDKDADYYRKLHITGTYKLIDGKPVINYFDEK